MTQGTPLFLQDPSFAYAAEDFRFLIDTLFTEGVLNVPAGDLKVTSPGDGSLRVIVAAGAAIIKGDDDATQGSYLARCTLAEYVAVPAPPSTGARLDLLVYELIDPAKVALVGRPKGARFRVVPGAPTTGTPVLPPVTNTMIPLASIAVAAGQQSVVTANITDLRTQAGAATLKVGTQAQPLTATQIAALSTSERFVGRMIENTSTGKLQHITAAGTAPIDVAPAAAGVIIDTTTTVPANGSITKRISVPVGAARGVLGVRGISPNGGIAFFTTAPSQAFAQTGGSAPSYRHRAIDASLINDAANTSLQLVDAYIDTATNELVLFFQSSTANVRTFMLYATYEVF